VLAGRLLNQPLAWSPSAVAQVAHACRGRGPPDRLGLDARACTGFVPAACSDASLSLSSAPVSSPPGPVAARRQHMRRGSRRHGAGRATYLPIFRCCRRESGKEFLRFLDYFIWRRRRRRSAPCRKESDRGSGAAASDSDSDSELGRRAVLVEWRLARFSAFVNCDAATSSSVA
jgi:hypothetical protein